MLVDANEFLKAIKSAATDAVDAKKPVNVFFGEVQEINPLKINVEQKMLLGEAQLVLTRNVTDFDTMVTVNWEAEDALGKNHSHKVEGQDSRGDSISLTTGETGLRHGHMLSGQKQLTIHNALEVGDEVVLVRQQEGQKYFVMDRIGGRG